MEVFLRGVPVDLTDGDLRKELKPVMKALGIVDWTCDKAKRKNLAWLTFLDARDGASFLAKHGNVTRPVPGLADHGQSHMARLHILRTAVYAQKSKRPVDSNVHSHLRHEKDERARRPQRDPQADIDVVFPIADMACGKTVFADDVLTFAQQTSIAEPAVGKFERRCFTAVMADCIRMDIAYDKVQDFVADYASHSMTFVLTHPPSCYEKLSSATDAVRWMRTTALPLWDDHAKYAAHCLVYRFTAAGRFGPTIDALRQLDNLPVTRHSLALDLHPKPHVHDYSTSINGFHGKIHNLGHARTVPFPILFQVQALVWNNYLHPSAGMLVLDILDRTAKDPLWSGDRFPFTTDAMKKAMNDIPYATVGVEPARLDPGLLMHKVKRTEMECRQADRLRSGIYGPSLPRRQAWVFKATVTPTRIVLLGPDPESKNRVLRMFPDHGDHFLRVSFADEDGRDLQLNPRISNDDLFARYRNVMSDGIQIAGRRFSFLGFSHSSLRSHSAWFLAPFIDQDMQRHDYDTILSSLGDFSEIRIPAKCAARIGQAFSETPYAVDLFGTNILSRRIADVTSADGKRVFSDGVGTISREAMEEVWNVLPMRSAAPTCIQIRWGGVKGMLALDSRLRGKVICVREGSMMKFPSLDRRYLGICDVASRPLRLVLNRQIIKILEDMGTADGWFLALQDKALNMLRGVTATAANTSTFLQYQDIGSTLGYPTLIRQLDKMGIDYRRDRFLRSVVEHVVLRELRELKHKARIPVDKGVTLFGVMDETGYLEEDEVYVTYEKTNAKSGYRMDDSLADGPVLVTRCPALHPGDVQLVRMKTPPPGHPLRDLRNCIVFSQRGARDLPSQLSGGDLDGDLYNVIWDARARPQRTFAPADYPRAAPKGLDRPVTRDDIADFFINFMKTDILGLIANRHQIMADVQPNGTNDPLCKALAGMHSTAVDYSKTGIPVQMNEMPKPPKTRPDFLAPAPPVKTYDLGQIGHIEDLDGDKDDDDGMGRAKHRYHKSEKILGQLYREVDEKRIWKEDISRTIRMDGPSVWDQVMDRVRDELDAYLIGARLRFLRHEEQAWKIRSLYEAPITELMWRFSDNPRACITEVEVFCGTVLNKTGTQTRQQRESSMRLKDETERIMAFTLKQIRNPVAGDGEDTGDDQDSSEASDDTCADEREKEVLRLCWACLVVGCVRDASEAPETYQGTIELESFRVLAAACLLKELNAYRSRINAASSGGGYLGVSSGYRWTGGFLEREGYWDEKCHLFE